MEAAATKPTFQKYSAYKNSGSDWSGQIPVDWESLPIRAIFEERNEKNDGPKTDFILSVTKDRGVIPYDEKGQIGNNKSEDIERYKVVYPNDFVINKMNVVIGSLGMSKYFGAFSQVYLVYKPKSSRINIEYYSYIFSNPSFYKSLVRFCTGIMELRESLNKNEFKKIVLPFPDFNTQTAIVRFLNDKTAKIDRAIAKKEQLIALLKERKQIIIQQAVTKGLNPNAKMKDSGVEWIGEIPEGWEVRKIKHIVKKAYSGGTPSTDKLEYWDGGIPWVSSVDVKVNKLLITQREISIEGLNRSSSNLCPEGAIIFVTRSGILQHTFAIAILGKKMAINQDIKCLILSDKVSSDFFLKLIQGNNDKILVETRQQAATVESINMESFFNLPIPLPPIHEQTSIVYHIENQSAKIDKAIKLQKQQIDKLKELKSTLIDSAVTGKIKII